MSLLKGGNELFANLDEKLASSTRNVILHEIKFVESTDADNESKKIYSKYKPLNASYNLHLNTKEHKEGKQIQRQPAYEKENAYLTPKFVLYPAEEIEMNWKEPRRIGPGFANLGNTCFLNSVLQVLTYTAPLVNFANSDAHRNSCATVGFCMLCEFRNHLIRVAKHNPQNGPIRPMTIIQRLSCISKNFKFGRQEDAHEFLRYVIEAFRKSCLAGNKNLDRFSKETTAINQIFGGFYRSQVTCLSCKISSNTFDPMMELNLDIKESKSVVEAMKRAVQTEKLDGENKYSCERCKKKVAALKRGNVHRPPKILTLQLKRFDFQRLFGGKISKDVAFEEILDISPFLSNKPESPVLYRLYAVLVHSGFSCNSGHYYCYVKAANGIWYEMNDSRVSQVGLQTVLRAQAYLLFYSLIGPKKSKQTSFKPAQNSTKQFIASSASTESKPGISAVKDIDLQLFKKSPRIVPLVGRDRVKFSLSGASKQKPTECVKENANPSSTSQRVPVGNGGFSKLSRESSLEAIRKEYDSSESEETPLSTEKSTHISEKISNNSDGNKSIEVEEKSVHTTPLSLPINSPLSSPKAISIENLHKRKVKTPNGIMNSKSKFGRWMPVSSSSCNFTPRSVLHRSLSDNSSVEKTKSASSKREVKRQFSVQIESKSQSEKIDRTKHWSVEENKRLDPPCGPMTSFVRPSVPDSDHCRERTSSVTSETGSVSTKTGEWDIHEKDLFDTPTVPYVQERHFAGWSVEDHSEKKSSDRENGEMLNGKSQTKVSKKLFGNHSDISHRSEKQSDKVSSGLDLGTSTKHGKTSRKRSSSEQAVLSDEDDLDTGTKRSRDEELESSESHRTRKKNKKSKKKKKNKSKKHDEDKNIDDGKDTKKKFTKKDTIKLEGTDRKSCRKEYDSREKLKKTEDTLNESIEITERMKERPKEDVRKKHKKSKKFSSNAKSDDLSGCAIGREKKRISSIGDDDDSRYSNVKPPRRISLNMLESTTMQSDGTKHVSDSNLSKLKGQSSRKEGLDSDEKMITPSKKSKNDIPEKQWDEKPRTATSWNGSNDNAVLDSLLSKKSKVTTWDDEASQNICHSVSGGSKRNRDRWDDEYDQGKVKKTKKRHGHSAKKYKDNPFQKLQNRRNFESNKR